MLLLLHRHLLLLLPPLLLLLLLLLLLPVAMATPASGSAGDEPVEHNDWVEYTPGTCNVVVAAPHGGWLRPADIRPRTGGCVSQQRPSDCLWHKGCRPQSPACRAVTGSDLFTYQLATTLVEELRTRHGCTPHFVKARVHRSRVDLNRDLPEAAQGSALAEAAWRQYHDQYLASAVAAVAERFGAGLVLDIHGQAHKEQWTELGYLLTRSDLNLGSYNLSSSSIRALGSRSQLSGQQLVSGASSLGGLLESLGHRCVPSPGHPSPGAGGYFSGGYTTRRFGSLAGGQRLVDAVQVEVPSDIRRDATKRRRFASDLADAVAEFRRLHY